MAAYLIIFAKIHDRARFLEDYGAPAAALTAEHGGEYVVRAPGVAALEGGLFDGHSAVVSRWPDRAAIDRFWTSPEYKKLKAARAGVADCHVMVVEAP